MFGKAFTIDNWRSRLSCKVLWRKIIRFKFTEKSRRAAQKLEAMVKTSSKTFLKLRTERLGERWSNPSRTREIKDVWKRRGCKPWSSKGSCQRGATCEFKHDDQVAREKETNDGGRRAESDKKTACSEIRSLSVNRQRPVRKRSLSFFCCRYTRKGVV